MWEELDSGLRLDTPRLAVALVQSEAEMLHTPGHELSAFLRRESRWRVESFTERTFEGLQRAASDFDCVVIGFNAAYQSEGIRQALRASGPIANMVVLHQQEPDALDFLSEEFAVELLALQPRTEKAFGREHRELDEILLNWPSRVLDEEAVEQGIDCPATRCYGYPPRTVWRAVMEAKVGSRRLPVMIRTSTTVERRIVLCTMLLQPRDEQRHAQLLENAITYCALGRPEVAVVESSGAVDATAENGRLSAAGLLSRKLRLQGASTVEVAPPEDGRIDFTEWPLREVSHVVLPRHADADGYLDRDDTKEFLQSGGTLVGVDETGRLTLHSGVSDAHWVAQRWAVWFNAADEDSWLGHLFSCRAVFRVLERVADRSSHAHPERVGIDIPPSEFAAHVRELLEREVSLEGDVDHLVSATVAAHDLNRLVGGTALSEPRLNALREWLLNSFNGASPEDRFDIARTFGGKVGQDLFKRTAAAAAGQPMSVVCLTRMREAAAACDVAGIKVAPEGVALDSLAELDARPQLCAEFIGALADLAQARPDDPLSRFDSELVDRAVGTLVKHGSIAQLPHDVRALDSEAISTEAVGLIAYFGLTRESTLLVRPETAGLPATAIEPVLRETRRARRAEQDAHDREERLRRPLSRVQLVVGLFALLLAGALGGFAAFGIALDVRVLTAFGIGSTVFVTVFVVLALLLVHYELYPRPGRRLATAVSEGWPGMRARLGKLIGQDDADSRSSSGRNSSGT